MKRYNEYKDSGVKWIGEIPRHWECRKLKTLLLSPLQYGANASGVPYSEHLPRYIRITDITLEGKLKHSDKLSLSNEDAAKYILKDKDILFARSGASVGKTFLYKKEYGLSAFAGYLIKAELGKELIPELLFYFTQSDIYESWKNGIFIQSTIQNIGADKYSQLQIAIPPLPEQEAIVTYLDSKVAKIDEYIAIAEKKIAALEELKQTIIAEAVTRGIHKEVPMKDSGVKWIGMIPEHWKMKSLRSYVKLYSEKNHPEKQLLSVTREMGVIVRNTESKEENHNFIPDDLSGYKLVRKGDFVINKMKSWQGSYGVSKYEGIVSPAYYVCKLEFPYNDFFSIAIRCKSYVPFFTQYSKGIRVDQWDLSPIALKNIPFMEPPITEQQEIVTYIEAKAAKIDQLCQAERSQIEKLKEYKQRLISDVVTGKVKVTND